MFLCLCISNHVHTHTPVRIFMYTYVHTLLLTTHYHLSHGQKECPPDSKKLGRHTWTFLHSIAAYFPDKPSAVEQSQMSIFMHSFGCVRV
jgi:hypothetical protein